MDDEEREALTNRRAPLEMSSEEFRRVGHRLVDEMAQFLGSLRSRKVTESPSVAEVKKLLGDVSLPSDGMPADALLAATTEELVRHSLFNGHPRFWGYVTSSAAPIGMLGDFLAAALNQNVGAWQLSPLASEIELQTVRWIAEFVGYPSDCGGLMVSGGNAANFVGFLAGRRARTPWDIRKEGLQGRSDRVCAYCSEATHTWVQKAADLFGLGTDALRWIRCDDKQRMDVRALEEQIEADRKAGQIPLLVAASAGTVGTGATDPIDQLADLCERHGLWLHVDGAYGGMAAALPEASEDLKAIRRADSIALDPHKWLYSPLEAGCTLVRHARDLPETFSFHPDYYKFEVEGEQPATNFYELGMQNSRGFRALKVWLAFRQVGSRAYVEMIRQDIRLARALWEVVRDHPDLEARTCHLSIATFRFVPRGLEMEGDERRSYLNELNETILERVQQEGDVFLSNAVIEGDYLLRACIVNFRTTLPDIELLPRIVARTGDEVDSALRPAWRFESDSAP